MKSVRVLMCVVVLASVAAATVGAPLQAAETSTSKTSTIVVSPSVSSEPFTWSQQTLTAGTTLEASKLVSSKIKGTNRNLTTAEIIAELVELAKKMRDEKNRSEELGLATDEIAFYDAVCQNDSAILQMGDDTLRKIAKELVKAVRSSISIDWNMKDSVRAEMRAKVKRLLARYDYPPDKEERAIDLVLEQAELVAIDEAA